jgi:hypothetical protein
LQVELQWDAAGVGLRTLVRSAEVANAQRMSGSTGGCAVDHAVWSTIRNGDIGKQLAPKRCYELVLSRHDDVGVQKKPCERFCRDFCICVRARTSDID